MASPTVIRLQLSAQSRKYFAYLRGLLSRTELYQLLLKHFDRSAQITAGHVVRTKLSGDPLHRRTGSLARSIIGRGEMLSGVPGFRVGALRGPATRYAAVQELGTVGKGGELPTIKPVRAKALAMPVNEALTRAGVARWPGPRDAPVNLKFVPFRRGISVGALYDEQDLERVDDGEATFEDIKPYYVLMAKADIRPKRFLRDGVRESLPRMAADLAAFLKNLVLGKPSGVTL